MKWNVILKEPIVDFYSPLLVAWWNLIALKSPDQTFHFSLPDLISFTGKLQTPWAAVLEIWGGTHFRTIKTYRKKCKDESNLNLFNAFILNLNIYIYIILQDWKWSRLPPCLSCGYRLHGQSTASPALCAGFQLPRWWGSSLRHPESNQFTYNNSQSVTPCCPRITSGLLSNNTSE